MQKTILIASGKGGVGKTLVATNLSVALSRLKYRVLLVDGNLKKPNIDFGKKHNYTIHDILAGEKHPEKAIYQYPNGLKVILGDKSIDGFDKINYKNYSNVLNLLKNWLTLSTKLKHYLSVKKIY